jgi:hypothetical protein
MIQTPSHELITLYQRKRGHTRKGRYSLDRALDIFKQTVSIKHQLTILKVEDIEGIRVLLVKDILDNLYVISLVIIHVGNKITHEQDIPLSKVISTTRLIAEQYEAIASSSFIELG